MQTEIQQQLKRAVGSPSVSVMRIDSPGSPGHRVKVETVISVLSDADKPIALLVGASFQLTSASTPCGNQFNNTSSQAIESELSW